MSDGNELVPARDYQLQRRIDQVDAKIDAVDVKVTATAEQTKSGFDNLNKLLEERWKSMEQRYDMDGRQKQQAIDLLTSTLVRLEQSQSATDVNLSMAVNDTRLIRAQMADEKHQEDAVDQALRKDVDHLTDLVKWASRTFWGGVLGGCATFIVYLVVHTPH